MANGGDTLDYEGKFEPSWEKGRKALPSCPGINLASVNSVSTERGFPFGSLSGERKTISGNETLRSRYFPVSCICTGYSGVGLVKRESGDIYIYIYIWNKFLDLNRRQIFKHDRELFLDEKSLYVSLLLSFSFFRLRRGYI